MNQKTYHDVINGKSDNNIRFAEFQNLLVGLGFDFICQKGSHIQYFHRGINVFVNIQKDGSKAKGYKVRPLRKIIIKYGLQEGMECQNIR